MESNFKKQWPRKLYPKQRAIFDVTKELETQEMTMNQELRSRNRRKGKILFENYAIRMKILADIESQIAADEKV
jgi:predicted KAP-like P-loop ATPase